MGTRPPAMSAAASSSSSSPRIRVLCLPGFGNDGSQMLGKMRKLRKVWGDNVECVAMTPPAVFGHPSVQGNAAACALTREEDFYVWWPRSYTHTFQGDHESLDFALRATRAFIEEHGPFDCCIGFSQGANFLAHLLPLLEKPWLVEAFLRRLVLGVDALLPSAVAHRQRLLCAVEAVLLRRGRRLPRQAVQVRDPGRRVRS